MFFVFTGRKNSLLNQFFFHDSFFFPLASVYYSLLGYVCWSVCVLREGNFLSAYSSFRNKGFFCHFNSEASPPSMQLWWTLVGVRTSMTGTTLIHGLYMAANQGADSRKRRDLLKSWFFSANGSGFFSSPSSGAPYSETTPTLLGVSTVTFYWLPL